MDAQDIKTDNNIDFDQLLFTSLHCHHTTVAVLTGCRVKPLGGHPE